ncbi:rhomboid family intramembrane serine protease [Acidocella sp.]|uniref:rhomboid family intramembrane serine protease n=1 Tax=Acidocella sp. TaxID=50710 RepID=UPI002615A19A|nr:rhomboid family intramembrane serine protease [Acidocella sp.]
MKSKKEPKWRNPTYPALPKNHWQSFNVRTGKVVRCDFNLRTAWRNLIAEKLFCPPNEQFFLNPLRIEGVGDALFAKWKRHQILIAFFCGVLGVAFYVNHGGGDQRFAIVMALFVLLVSVNLATSASASDLADKSEFLTDVAVKGRTRMWFPLVMAAISFAASQFGFGTFDSAAYAYGALISKVDAFQWWRLVTGPFIHYSVTAWVLNNVLLALVFPIAAYRSTKLAIILFIVGSTFSEIAYVLMAILGFPHEDLLVGFSGGIFALLGFIQFDCILMKNKYPKMFWALVASFILLNIVGVQILVSHVSLTAHVSGFIIGTLAAFLFNFLNRAPDGI